MTWVFTVIDISEWALLFDGERMVDQGHSIELIDIVSRASGRPVVLRYVSADGSQLDDEIYEAGDADFEMTLSAALAKCGRGKRIGFTS